MKAAKQKVEEQISSFVPPTSTKQIVDNQVSSFITPTSTLETTSKSCMIFSKRDLERKPLIKQSDNQPNVKSNSVESPVTQNKHAQSDSCFDMNDEEENLLLCQEFQNQSPANKSKLKPKPSLANQTSSKHNKQSAVHSCLPKGQHSKKNAEPSVQGGNVIVKTSSSAHNVAGMPDMNEEKDEKGTLCLASLAEARMRQDKMRRAKAR